MLSILIIEDDSLIGHATERWLSNEHQTTWVKSIQQATDCITQNNYDMILLDLGLPDGSGFDLLRNIRRKKISTGIIIMTAYGDVDDRIIGLDLGADDFLVKPIDFKELDARIRAVRRRHNGLNSNTIEHQTLSLDLNAKSLIQEGKSIHLSKKELAIITVLLEGRGRYYSKTQIEQKLYLADQEIDSNAIEVHISSLRKKLGKTLIKTTRGLGYIIEKST